MWEETHKIRCMLRTRLTLNTPSRLHKLARQMALEWYKVWGASLRTTMEVRLLSPSFREETT